MEMGITVLNRGVKEGLTMNGTFKQKPKGSDEVCCIVLGRRTFQTEEFFEIA